VLIARTDALTVEGLGAAIERAQVYAASGADVIFIEAPVTIEEIEAIARHVPQPKLIKMLQGGKRPLVPVARLETLGYQIVIIPSDLQRATARAGREVRQLKPEITDSRAIARHFPGCSEPGSPEHTARGTGYFTASRCACMRPANARRGPVRAPKPSGADVAPRTPLEYSPICATASSSA